MDSSVWAVCKSARILLASSRFSLKRASKTGASSLTLASMATWVDMVACWRARPELTIKSLASRGRWARNLAGSCSAKRRQPWVPRSRSIAFFASGCPVRRKSEYSRSSGWSTSSPSRKWVGMVRAFFSSAIVTTEWSTTLARSMAPVGFPSESRAVTFRRTFSPGVNDPPGLAPLPLALSSRRSIFRLSTTGRQMSLSATGTSLPWLAFPLAGTLPGSTRKTVRRQTPPSSGGGESSTLLSLPETSLESSIRPRQYSPTNHMASSVAARRTGTEPPASNFSVSTRRETPRDCIGGSGILVPLDGPSNSNE